MTPEQNLIAALKEAITAIRRMHNETPLHVCPESTIEKWLAVRVTCRTCDGGGRVCLHSWSLEQLVECQTCGGSGKRLLKDVI